jgi:hypothetical protein
MSKAEIKLIELWISEYKHFYELIKKDEKNCLLKDLILSPAFKPQR